jgi:hypothetical protein
VTADDQIGTFWEWFATARESLPEEAAAVEELDRRVSDLGCPAWEIGPGERAEWFLALSPDGDPASLALTRKVVGAAPSIPGWELLSHRPRKQWDLRFEIESESGPIEVDARTWRFVAYRYPDGLYDLVILADDPSLAPPDRDLAVYLADEGQLGEEALMTVVNRIEAVTEVSDAEVERSRSLSSLVTLGA